ncbi:hypothetical protein QFZ32_006925 [Streptomyces canus]|uniref:Uncharacterized protein n=1 Tax=Streptomyces canus TaxID=58343 RepID=A0AAW8FQ63_9ACTN|nr:hypothetical protein [Streptomyces canus]MDQ0911505.1 hypothetical protein [Streptomyces canus]MDQ1071485.1 hypothetical protein [Streptomyces canus]
MVRGRTTAPEGLGWSSDRQGASRKYVLDPHGALTGVGAV